MLRNLQFNPNEMNFDEFEKKIYCKLCHSEFSCDGQTKIERHVTTPKHVKAKQRLTQPKISSADFNNKLMNMIMKTNLPFGIVDDNDFKKFIFEISGFFVPSSRTLRDHKIEEEMFEKEMNIIKSKLVDVDFCIQVDGTSSKKKFVTNILMAPLIQNQQPIFYLVTSKCSIIPPSNVTVYSDVVNAIDEMIQPQFQNRFRLLLTDQAQYNIKASTELKTRFTLLKHVTCLAHSLDTVAKTVKKNFQRLKNYMNHLTTFLKIRLID